MSDTFIIDQNITTGVASQWFSPQGDSVALAPIGASPPQKLRDMPLETYVILSGGTSCTATVQWQVANNNTSWANIGSAKNMSTGTNSVAGYQKLTTLYKQMIRLNVTAISGSGARIDVYARIKRT